MLEGLAAETWAAVDWLAEAMHAHAVRDLGGVEAPWSRCRGSTRRYWRKAAKRIMCVVVASRLIR